MKRVILSICELAMFALTLSASELERDFRSPPLEAHSYSWWHWQDGFLNAEEIEKELSFMRKAGFGGLQQFVAGWTRIPTNGEHLVEFMSDEWLGFSRRALKSAATNGLEYGFQNGAGWTGVGGPWMTTEKSMKHIFAVERHTSGGKTVTLPPLGDGQYVEGTYVNYDRTKPWYGDIRTFAFPTPKAFQEPELPQPIVSGVPAVPELSKLFARNSFSIHEAHKHPPVYEFFTRGETKEDPVLRFEWEECVTVRSIWLKGLCDAEDAEVWASDDGKNFQFITKFSSGYMMCEDMYAGRFHALPATNCRVLELRWKRPCAVRLYEVGFSSRPRLTGFEDQCGRGTWNPFRRVTVPDETESNLDPKAVLDITDRIAVDGTLTFTPPDMRDWTVLRIAATSTRRSNQPTNPDMSGPVCDILDAQAIRFHLSQYIGKMLEVEKDVGVKAIGNILLDSWEQGTANWTKTLPDEFRKRRGYDLVKYLPVFGGYFVGSRETTERFLWDFRKTITEVVRDNFFGVISEYCRQHNLKHYVEGFACGVGTFMGDPMMAYLNCDVPMTEAGPTVREASSAAHLLGRKLVAVEAQTSAADWSRTPRDFKAREDAHFRHGITRLIYHGGAHNPKSEWRFPGLAFGGYGAELSRGQTWAKYMPLWQEYLARCQYMLRRGAFVADVLAFAGEDYSGHVVGVYENGHNEAGAFARDRMKGLPPGFDYDLVNAEFLSKLSVFADGSIGFAGSPDATHYRVLVLREQDYEMSVETAREILRLVKAGAVVVGPKIIKSLGSPENASVADAEVATISAALLKSSCYHIRETVSFVDEAKLSLRPDFIVKGARAGDDINYLHRREGDSDIYYVVRWRKVAEGTEMGFRVTGKVPRIFDPLTGQIAIARSWRTDGEYTYLPVFGGEATEATRFIVFEPAPAATPSDCVVSANKIIETCPIDMSNLVWTIHFKDELGVDKTIVTNQLFDWKTHPDSEIATFSGTAVYETSIELPSELAYTTSSLYLSLGCVEELCEVFVNGISYGVAWCEPYEVKIPHAALAKNAKSIDLEIRVVNSWHNRLLADQNRPKAERKTFTICPPNAKAKPVAGGLLGPVLKFRTEEDEIATPESQGVDSAALLKWIDALEKFEYIHGFVVRRHGHVIAEGSWKPFDTLHEVHMLYSHSKSFTSTAVGFLVDDGKLDLDECIVDILPEKAPPKEKQSENLRKVRVRDLLTMNAGTLDDVNLMVPEGDWVKAYFNGNFAVRSGTEFHYSTISTHVLGAIVEKRSGMNLMSFLKKRLFDKIGIRGAWTTHSPTGLALGGSGMRMTTRDLSLLGQFYLQEGMWNGERLLSKEYIRLATARQSWSRGGIRLLHLVEQGGDWEQGYGFQFWRCRHDSYRADGACGQLTLVIPKEDMVISIHSGTGGFQDLLNTIWDILLPGVGRKALTETPTTGILARRCASLMIPPVTDTKGNAAKFTGQTFFFSENPRGFRSVRLEEKEGRWSLALQVRGDEYSFPVGRGEWQSGKCVIDPEPDVESWCRLNGVQPVRSSGGVQPNGDLIIQSFLTETPARIVFHFYETNGVKKVSGDLWAMGGCKFESR